jgi:hypothetical protein
MSLKCIVTYNKHLDKLVGFPNDQQLENEVLFFMIRRIAIKWKQAIANFFTRNTVHLTEIFFRNNLRHHHDIHGIKIGENIIRWKHIDAFY